MTQTTTQPANIPDVASHLPNERLKYVIFNFRRSQIPAALKKKDAIGSIRGSHRKRISESPFYKYVPICNIKIIFIYYLTSKCGYEISVIVKIL